jgi:peptidoglycan/LPS O-acetylase OafA/YrhL
LDIGRWTVLAHWIETATSDGSIGVDLFFVLSGFLITGVLLDSVGEPHYFRKFYGRRALRILPLYYLILVLIAICYKGSGHYVLLSTLYLSNLAPMFGIVVSYDPLWSLSVEEHFYLIWPWLVSRLGPQRIWILAAAVCLVEPVVRGFGFLLHLQWTAVYYSWFRFDELAGGALLVLFVRSRRCTRERLYWLGLGCLGGFGVIMSSVTLGTFAGAALPITSIMLLGVGIVSITLSEQVRPLTGLMRSRWLRKCGELSYCLYIIHWLVFYGWDSLIGMYPSFLVSNLGRLGAVFVRAATVYIVCFALAELSHRYFEGPFLSLKRYFAYAPTADPGPAKA